MKKFIKIVLSSLIFIVVLLTVYYIHVSYFPVNVVFYAAIADAVIAALLSSLIILFLSFFSIIGPHEKFLLVCVWILSGYAFAISVPTVLDRSLSFYILEKLQQRGGGIRKDRMSEVFINEYLKEHRLVDVRLTEQIQSGTIEITPEGCVKLTAKGEKIASVSRFFRMNLLPKKRLLMGEYSDDLTNPFRNSVKNPDYLCR